MYTFNKKTYLNCQWTTYSHGLKVYLHPDIFIYKTTLSKHSPEVIPNMIFMIFFTFEEELIRVY